jgi:hypothetical protein
MRVAMHTGVYNLYKPWSEYEIDSWALFVFTVTTSLLMVVGLFGGGGNGINNMQKGT